MSNKLTFIQISPDSFAPPTDVTLKLSDGNIGAHRMILAAVSPVFEKMLYGNFKESSLSEVNLPEDNCKNMKMLIDFVYTGGYQVSNVDDIFPLAEVIERYQINKLPLYHLCGKTILSQMDSSNYLTLLSQFACVMDEISIKRAADKVMCYTNNNFIANFDEVKDLPEEVILSLLPRDDLENPEVDIFNFLVRWHAYQTEELGNTLQLIPQLFQHIRYALIHPRLLIAKVTNCDHVDKQLLAKALDCLYNKPLQDKNDECKCGECSNPQTSDKIRTPRIHVNAVCDMWQHNNNNARVSNDKLQVYYNSFNYGTIIIKSNKLKNGICSLKITNATPNSDNLFVFSVYNNANSCLHKFSLKTNHTITMLIYENDLFLKIFVGNEISSTSSIVGQPPFTISILGDCAYNYSGSFEIYSQV